MDSSSLHDSACGATPIQSLLIEDVGRDYTLRAHDAIGNSREVCCKLAGSVGSVLLVWQEDGRRFQRGRSHHVLANLLRGANRQVQPRYRGLHHDVDVNGHRNISRHGTPCVAGRAANVPAPFRVAETPKFSNRSTLEPWMRVGRRRRPARTARSTEKRGPERQQGGGSVRRAPPSVS